MQSKSSNRSWWRAMADFVKALEDDSTPFDVLTVRVAALEKQVATLGPAREREPK